MKQTNIFRNCRTNQVFKTSHVHVKPKISYIYSHIKYANFKTLEKVRLLFKIRLNNHRKNAKSGKPIIEQIRKQTTTEETRKLLKKWENFWILKVTSLYPGGLNQKLDVIYWLYLPSSAPLPSLSLSRDTFFSTGINNNFKNLSYLMVNTIDKVK